MKIFEDIKDFVKDFDYGNLFQSLLFVVIFILINRIILYFLKRIDNKIDSVVMRLLLKAFEGPLTMIMWSFGIYFALTHFTLVPTEWNDFLNKVDRTFIVLVLFQWIFKALKSKSEIILYIEEKTRLDIIFITFSAKFIQVFLGLMAFVIIAQEWGYDANGFLAGLGIGGVAVALAAKDTLSNIIAGMSIILDKTYSIGDKIKTVQIEGIVEDINFRSTKIKQSDGSVIVFPNYKIANDWVINLSRMEKENIIMNLKLDIQNSKKDIKNILPSIKYLLRIPELEENTISVRITGVTEEYYELTIKVTVLTEQTEQGLKTAELKEEQILLIMDLLKNENIILYKKQSPSI